MSEDLLGFDRFEQHQYWRCSGRIEGEIDEIEPSTWTVERSDDRWVFATGQGQLIAVGDKSRDLVATGGGLEREPAGSGFRPYLAANLLRQSESFAWVRSCEVVRSTDATHANRLAVDVRLSQGGYEMTLGVDAETGIWTLLRTDEITITVDVLTLNPPGDPAFRFLDAVPDIDLSHREPVAPALSPILKALEEASGLEVEVHYQDEETGEFTFLLVEDGKVQALIDRTHAESTPRPAIFGGAQDRWDTEDWTYAIDAVTTDRMWPRPIVKALERF